MEHKQYQNDFKRIMSLTPVKNQDATLEEFVLKSKDGTKNLGPCLVDEGSNDKGHGQKGHRKAYLCFNFNNEGKLIDICVTVPSIKETFTFVENATDELES